MKRFIEDENRSQAALLPDCLDYHVTEDNPVPGLPEGKFKMQEPAGSAPPWFRNKGMRIATVRG